ncbi:MAG TPA: ATP-binding protein [Gemmatimonadaceae bacterium]|nr:ATP-binding protein [Gemmatimonadaceae bacterium]
MTMTDDAARDFGSIEPGSGFGHSLTPLATHAAEVLVGGNEMGELMRAFDWASSPVGPVEGWPQSLRTALNILLDSRYPMYIAWGPQFVQFYNDGYRPILGATKHPAALGRSTRETFVEIWDFIGPMFEEVMRSGRPTYLEDQILPLDRNGYVEECYFTFCYSAVRTESGDVGGVFVTVSENTARVLGERRLRTLRDLGTTSTTVRDIGTAISQAARVLDENPADIPFSLIYLVEEGGEARLAAQTGLEAGHRAAPPNISLTDATSSVWPAASGARELILVEGVERDFGEISSRVWPEHVQAAVLLPINPSGEHGTPDALLVMGLNPRRAFDDDYRDFVGLVAGQIGAAITAAREYEEERRRAQALAELDRAKTTFFSNVSHEFRTPLTLMLGPIEDLLLRPASPLAPEDREKLHLLQRNGLRLLKLVNTLLDFARIEAGRVQASYEPVDLAHITVDLASAFRAAVERAGMRLVVECEDVGEPVYVDTSMWEKIVLNLLSNAFKFTLEGEIRVALERVDDARFVRLTVADTGGGIAADELPHIFERFRRVEGGARVRTHEGSGIGLALVQELVRLHGGRVGVESTVGVGSVFTVDLPLGSAHLPAERIRAEATGASTALGAAPFVEEALRWLPDAADVEALAVPGLAFPGIGENERVAATDEDGARARLLVVDDNADMRAYLANLLRPRYEVDLACDGAEALARARSNRPDLIVSDVMMPVLDGLGLIRELRSDPATAAVPVILLSARAGEESTVEGLAGGADDYLVKPFSARELLARVRAHLQFSEALRKERARLVSLFDQAPAFMAVVTGPDHVINAVNAAYLALIGRGEVVGKPLLEALPELAGQGFRELLEGVYATGKPYVGREARVMLSRAAGEAPEESFVDFVYQPIVKPDGRISGVLVQGVDVSAQVRAREEMQRLYESVRDANEAKRQFLAAMSHELRTPLNAIMGYADLLALGVRGPMSEAQLADLDRIRSASEYLLTLITDVLDFSRVEAGKVELRPSEVRVESVVGRARDLMQAHIESRGIHFDVVPPDPELALFADQERLQQILLNLLVNASKFTPSGGSIRVWAESDDSMVRLHVEDTGVGIPESQREQIFEPFVQLDRLANRESQQGVGLGLAISRDLARRMGGDLIATSAASQGSRFILTVPRAEPAK